MTQQNVKSTVNAAMSERRHSDPPRLWVAVVLGSIVIHLGVFGVLRLVLMGRITTLEVRRELIPVEAIAQAPKATSSTRPTPTTVSSASRDRSTVNTPTKPNQLPNRSAIRTDSPQTRTQQGNKSGVSGTTKQSPSGNKVPTGENSSATKPSQNQQPGKSTQKPSPVTNPSQNKPPGTQKPPNKGTNPGGSGNSGTPSPSNPKPSPGSGNGQNSSNSQSRGARVSRPKNNEFILVDNQSETLHPGDPNYNDELASWLAGDTQLSGEELKQLGITLDGELKLQVKVLIETNGRGEVLPNTTKVLSGNVKPDKAEQLASKIIQQWKFKPTTMTRKDNPVPRAYYIPLTVEPIQA